MAKGICKTNINIVYIRNVDLGCAKQVTRICRRTVKSHNAELPGRYVNKTVSD